MTDDLERRLAQITERRDHWIKIAAAHREIIEQLEARIAELEDQAMEAHYGEDL